MVNTNECGFWLKLGCNRRTSENCFESEIDWESQQRWPISYLCMLSSFLTVKCKITLFMYRHHDRDAIVGLMNIYVLCRWQCQLLVSSPLWSRLKYLNNRLRWNFVDIQSPSGWFFLPPVPAAGLSLCLNTCKTHDTYHQPQLYFLSW